MKTAEKLQLINALKIEADGKKPLQNWDQEFLEKVKIDISLTSIRSRSLQISIKSS